MPREHVRLAPALRVGLTDPPRAGISGREDLYPSIYLLVDTSPPLPLYKVSHAMNLRKEDRKCTER